MGDKKYSFKCMEQNCENRVCCTREHVDVTLGDLSRWSAQGYLPHILPGLTLIVPESEDEEMRLETSRRPLKDREDTTACVFYHEEANACTIRYSRPLSCRTFPLRYNGDKFYVVDRDCPGIGKGEVTKESLKGARETAEQEYRERLETRAALPAIYTVIVAQMVRRSAEAMQSLSDEDRKRIEEILSRGQDDSAPADTGQSTGA